MSLNDNIGIRDINPVPDKMIRKTEVIIGTDAYEDENGVTQFGEVLFHGHNMVVYGGSLFTLQKVFDLPRLNPLRSEYLEKEYNLPEQETSETKTITINVTSEGKEFTIADRIIDITDVSITNNSSTTSVDNYTFDRLTNRIIFSENILSGSTITIIGLLPDKFDDTCVCLFGLGTCGSGDSITDVYKVNYSDRTLGDPSDNQTTTDTGILSTLIPLIPFRRVPSTNNLLLDEKNKYWFKKSDVQIGSESKDHYYLKEIESKDIKVRSASGNIIESEAALETATDAVDTFVELKLVIDSADEETGDLKEYFRDSGHIELSRFNSIGLFTAVKVPLKERDPISGQVLYDYRNVKLYSKLNIPNEIINGSKEITITYRIFAS